MERAGQAKKDGTSANRKCWRHLVPGHHSSVRVCLSNHSFVAARTGNTVHIQEFGTSQTVYCQSSVRSGYREFFLLKIQKNA